MINGGLLWSAELIYHDKQQAFATISLSKNMIAERVVDVYSDLDSQLSKNLRSFFAFFIAIDESTAITEIAQLAVFICEMDIYQHKRRICHIHSKERYINRRRC
ncbi:General transcription factor II-I repeat domain-containing protein 2 [Thelohanellus kitauei]|uniref:General transcription factor II-I repeat domain-containing protein 2 n=1 Tax=Thelohanellus kitauei TaxID=669202 RepID=A0A0C2M954_THEKT|nr:General transcription factor II-I repeat domain-containing protein 2 [Thelohanellus kitauei]